MRSRERVAPRSRSRPHSSWLTPALLVAAVLALTACTAAATTTPSTPGAATPAATPGGAQGTTTAVVAATPASAPAAASPAVSPGASAALVASPATAASPASSPTASASPAAKPVASGAGLTGTIKIVSSLPRTGSSKAQSDTIVNAIKMALDEAGNKVGGATIVYEDLDDATPARSVWDAGKEAENANKAAADVDTMVYIGPYNSAAATISIPILNRANLVTISPTNTFPGLTKPGKGEPKEPDVYYPTGIRTYARVVPTDDVQGAVAAHWAKALGAKKVYVLHDTERFGSGVAAVFADTATTLGLTVVGGPEGIDPKAPDYRALAVKVREASPDLVYFGGIAQNNAGKLFTDMRAALGQSVKLMGADGIYEQAFLDDAGDGAEGVFVTFGGIAPSKLTGKGADWYRAYKTRFKSEPGAYAAYGYEAAKVALDAIARAGTKDREAIRQAVFNTANYEGVLGTWSFDANGDTTLTTMSGREVKNGTFDDANAVILKAE
ncbi:MAG: branched-chain amino acid ABC transporter substrate-binding protein [Chloroflexi bacterium]|nr:branched-chain amino acid ABC transporter substrate-binding protein [Chloroflexota bacterium]